MMKQQISPDQKYFKKYIYNVVLANLIFFIILIPFCLVILGEKDNGLLVLMMGSLGIVIIDIIVVIFSRLWINNLSYFVNETSITIYKGIFTKIEQNIPNSKVTDFVLYRDIFDRFLGIGSIKVQTAGASGESGFEGELNGILDYENTHKSLRDKLVSLQSNKSEKSEGSNSIDNDLLLSDILEELKLINAKLERNSATNEQ